MKQSINSLRHRFRQRAADLARDSRGIAVAEFALIVPLMLTLFFGVVEISNGVAVDRKVTRVARALSDLTSQFASVSNTDLQNFFAASGAIMSTYAATPIRATLSEVYVDANRIAKIQWSTSATISDSGGQTSATLAPSARNVGDVVAVNANLAVPDTYLIWSEVSYRYVPVVGYIMNAAGVTLSDETYTRPRKSECVPWVVSQSQTLGGCS